MKDDNYFYSSRSAGQSQIREDRGGPVSGGPSQWKFADTHLKKQVSGVEPVWSNGDSDAQGNLERLSACGSTQSLHVFYIHPHHCPLRLLMHLISSNVRCASYDYLRDPFEKS